MSEYIKLNTGVDVLVRGDSALQFGLDATRAGVVDISDIADANAATLASTLRSLRRPQPLAALIAALEGEGLSRSRGFALIDDLLAFRILHWVRPHPVSVLGSGPLATLTVAMLKEAGATVRVAASSDQAPEFISSTSPEVPLLVLNQLGRADELAALLAQYRRNSVSAAMLGARGVVGPAVVGSEGPCLICVDLHRMAVDPFWRELVEQHSKCADPARDNPVVTAVTAALTAAMGASLAGIPAPPGSSTTAPVAGQVYETEATGISESYRVAPHRLCPVCFYRN